MKMGLQFGLEKGLTCKRQFRWMFYIPGVCGDESPGVDALPPEKSARPSLSFKEANIQHLSEEVFVPVKPDWRPITVTLYDLKRRTHPVFDWVKAAYDGRTGRFRPAYDSGLFRDCYLTMLDAAGYAVEYWAYEDAWPQAVNFQTLDMASGGIVTCEITLRYARAYTFSTALGT